MKRINNLVDNVYVLNLEEDIFKYEILKRKLDQKGIEHERFVGTGRQNYIEDSDRGKQTTKLHYEVELFLEIAEKYKDSELFEHMAKALGHMFSHGGGAFRCGGATGCRISHLRIIEDAIENNYENILMLQDDIFFHKQFEYMLDKHSNLIKQSDIFWLGASEYDAHVKKNRWQDPNWNYFKGREDTYGKWAYQPTPRTFGWYSVYLNKKTFKDVLELLKLELFAADQCLNLIARSKYKNSSWVAHPNLIISDTLHSKTWKGVSFESGKIHRPMEDAAAFKGWNLDYYDISERYYEVRS